MPLGIGFMGNLINSHDGTSSAQVTNASRHWVHGELLSCERIGFQTKGHKCLSALGSWGTWRGFKGPLERIVTNASRHWVHGEQEKNFFDTLKATWSQMPLGIGFMGNWHFLGAIVGGLAGVTNASRHWVHGEPERHLNPMRKLLVTNASRHWVHGEPMFNSNPS